MADKLAVLLFCLSRRLCLVPIFGYTSMYLHNCCHIMYDVVKVHVKTFVVK